MGWPLVKRDAHRAGWSFVFRCRFDMPASLAAIQPANISWALSRRDSADRPAQIEEGEADISLARDAHRGSPYVGIALANREAG